MRTALTILAIALALGSFVTLAIYWPQVLFGLIVSFMLLVLMVPIIIYVVIFLAMFMNARHP